MTARGIRELIAPYAPGWQREVVCRNDAVTRYGRLGWRRTGLPFIMYPTAAVAERPTEFLRLPPLRKHCRRRSKRT